MPTRSTSQYITAAQHRKALSVLGNRKRKHNDLSFEKADVFGDPSFLPESLGEATVFALTNGLKVDNRVWFEAQNILGAKCCLNVVFRGELFVLLVMQTRSETIGLTKGLTTIRDRVFSFERFPELSKKLKTCVDSRDFQGLEATLLNLHRAFGCAPSPNWMQRPISSQIPEAGDIFINDSPATHLRSVPDISRGTLDAILFERRERSFVTWAELKDRVPAVTARVVEKLKEAKVALSSQNRISQLRVENNITLFGPSGMVTLRRPKSQRDPRTLFENHDLIEEQMVKQDFVERRDPALQ